MNHSIGSYGPIGTPGLGHAAIEQAEPMADAAEPEHAAGLLAAMKPARAERQRVADEPAESTEGDAAEPGDDSPPSVGSPMFAVAAPMAGPLERGFQPPTHRLPGDSAPISRVDRRRKRRC